MPDEHHHEDGNDRMEFVFDSASIPEEDDAPMFEAPWQARAFSLAVTIHRDEGHFEWKAFQKRLAEEIQTKEAINPTAVGEEYYQRWLAALEQLLINEEYLTEEQLSERALEFADGDRTAAEFVEGEHDH